MVIYCLKAGLRGPKWITLAPYRTVGDLGRRTLHNPERAVVIGVATKPSYGPRKAYGRVGGFRFQLEGDIHAIMYIHPVRFQPVEMTDVADMISRGVNQFKI